MANQRGLQEKLGLIERAIYWGRDEDLKNLLQEVDIESGYSHSQHASLLKSESWINLLRELNEVAPKDSRFELRDVLLLYALRQGTSRTVETILKSGADPNGKGFSLSEAWKSRGRFVLDKLTLLLQYGASVEKASPQREIPPVKIVEVAIEIVKRGDGNDLLNSLWPYFCSEKALPQNWKERFLEVFTHYRRGDLLEILFQKGFDPATELKQKDRETLIHTWAKGSFFSKEGLTLHQKYTNAPSEKELEKAKLALELLLSVGLNINTQDSQGNTPLHYACKNGEPQIIELLLQRGADPGIQNHEGKPPIFLLPPWSVKNVLLLLEHGVPPTIKDKKGTPLLIEYAKQGLGQNAQAESSARSLLILLERGADPKEEDPEGFSFLATLLSKAGIGTINFPEELFHKIVQKALELGADPNRPSKSGKYPLHYAVEDPKLTQILLQAGAFPNVWDSDGNTPAHFAAEKRKIEVLSLLKATGANLNIKNLSGEGVGFHYFYNLVQVPKIEEIKELLALGVDLKEEKILFRILSNWNKDWHQHLIQSGISTIRFLIEEVGISPNAKDINGNTPLHLACSQEDQVLATLFSQLGVKPWERNLEGYVPGDFLVGPRYPLWALRLGILPLNDEEGLFEVLQDEKKVARSVAGIKKFVEGVLREEPITVMTLLPHLLSPTISETARKIVKEVVGDKPRLSPDFEFFGDGLIP